MGKPGVAAASSAAAALLHCLLDSLMTMEVGCAPRNPTPLISRKWSKEVTPPFPSNLLSLLPSVWGLEGIRVE